MRLASYAFLFGLLTLAGCGNKVTPTEVFLMQNVVMMEMATALNSDRASESGWDSVAIIVDPQPPGFSGPFDNSSRQTITANQFDDARSLYDYWVTGLGEWRNVRTAQPSFDTVLGMFEKQKTQQGRRASPEDPAVAVGRLLGADLVLYLAPKGHFHVPSNAYGQPLWYMQSASVQLRYRVFETASARQASAGVLNDNMSLAKWPPEQRKLLQIMGNPDTPRRRLHEQIVLFLEEFPNSVQGWIVRSNVASEIEDNESLLEAGRRLCRLKPTHATGYFAQGCAFRAMGDPVSALRQFTEASERTRSDEGRASILEQLALITDPSQRPSVAALTAAIETAGGRTETAGRAGSQEQLIEGLWPSVVSIQCGSYIGSGLVVDSWIVTNHHVVDSGEPIEVRFHDGIALDARIAGVDSDRDLALLEVRHGGMVGLPLSPSLPEVGTTVFALGNALGLGQSVTKGIVGAIRTVDGLNFIQTDAAINPGNSGGPLVDDSGRVVGINTLKATRGEGIGLAIPANDIERLVTRFR